jgi:hypothetical protein
MYFILARRSWAERHWVYSGHFPRIFVAQENAQNTETKRQSRAVPIQILAILALATSAYSSLGVLQGMNPQHWLLKASVYHSATSADGDGDKGVRQGMVTATKRAMVTEMTVAGNKEGNGDEEGNGNCN